jgi:hypothetical protein
MTKTTKTPRSDASLLHSFLTIFAVDTVILINNDRPQCLSSSSLHHPFLWFVSMAFEEETLSKETQKKRKKSGGFILKINSSVSRAR